MTIRKAIILKNYLMGSQSAKIVPTPVIVSAVVAGIGLELEEGFGIVLMWPLTQCILWWV